MVIDMNPFEDFKVLEEYMKKHPPVGPIGVKVIIENGEIIKILGLYYYGEKI